MNGTTDGSFIERVPSDLYHTLLLQARRTRHAYDERVYLRKADNELLRGWQSEIIDTSQLSPLIDVEAWASLRVNNQPLRPEVLSTYFSLYGLFNPIRENEYIYSTNGIESHKGKCVIGYIGPSASGKDTLLDMLIQWYRDHVGRIITDTTRKRRVHQNELRDAYNFEQHEFLEGLAQQNKIVEGIRQGEDIYATEIIEVIKALRGEQRAIFWRGDVIGYTKVKDFCALLGIPLVCVAVLPGLTDFEMVERIQSKRGSGDEQLWRIQKARKEIELFGCVADYMIINPPGSPIVGARALEHLTLRLIGHTDPLEYGWGE